MGTGEEAQALEDSGAMSASTVLRLTNDERRKVGAPALCLNSQLNRAAQRHTDDMASTGSSVGQRVTRAGYQWSAVAENVARGQSDGAAAVRSWMNSDGHRRNILNSRYRNLGYGEHRNRWYTQVFGSLRSGSGCSAASLDEVTGEIEVAADEVVVDAGAGEALSLVETDGETWFADEIAVDSGAEEASASLEKRQEEIGFAHEIAVDAGMKAPATLEETEGKVGVDFEIAADDGKDEASASLQEMEAEIGSSYEAVANVEAIEAP